MKRLLAGLAVGLVAAIVLQSRHRTGESRTLPRPDTGRDDGVERQRTAGTGEPPAAPQERVKIARVGPEAVAARDVAAATRRQVPKAAAARSAEEVLNSATRQQLLSVYGIGPVLADRIMQNRPYAAAYDVVEQGIIPESIFLHLKRQLLDQPSA
jgi:hypothetical protein